jgi:hypothetical protein
MVPTAKSKSRPLFPDSADVKEESDSANLLNPCVTIPDDSDSSNDSSEDSSSSESESEVKDSVLIWNRLAMRQAPKEARKDIRDRFFYHSKLHTLHACSEADVSTLSCGRRITPVYQELFEEPSFEFPRCRVCFPVAA